MRFLHRIQRTTSHLNKALFLSLILAASLFAKDQITLSWKSVPQKTGGSQESGILELTLNNNSGRILRNTTLSLEIPEHVSLELADFPISYLSAGGEISFLLPYSMKTIRKSNNMLLTTAQLSTDSKNLQVALINN